MFEWYSNFIHGALGPYSGDLRMTDEGDFMFGADLYTNIGARTICADGSGYHWIISMPTDANCGALGPFDINQLVMSEDTLGVVTGVMLEDKVESMALGTLCFDTYGSCWIIGMPTDSNEDQSFHAPGMPTGSHSSEVKEDVYFGGIIDGWLAESDQAVEPTTPRFGDLFGEYAAAGAGMETDVRGDEGVFPSVDVDALEPPLGDFAIPEQGAHLLTGESQSVGPIQCDNFTGFEDLCASLELKIDEILDAAGDGADRGAPILSISHEATATRMEIAVRGDEGLASMMNVNCRETPQGDNPVGNPVLEQAGAHSLGVSRSRAPPEIIDLSSEGESELRSRPPPEIIDLSSEGESEAQTAREKVSGEPAKTTAKHGGSRKPGGKPTRKRARISKQSPRSLLNGVGDGANRLAPIVPTSQNEAAAPGIMVTDSNGNEALSPPVHGNFLETPQSD